VYCVLAQARLHSPLRYLVEMQIWQLWVSEVGWHVLGQAQDDEKLMEHEEGRV
jgi:hypothetical protein